MEIKVVHNAGVIADAIARKPEQVLPAVDKALFRGAIEVADEAKRRAPKYRSLLTNSIQIRAKPLEYTIVAAAKYAAAVEGGSKPGGRPSLREMLAWVTLKRIVPRTPGMTRRSLAALIRMRIAQQGIKAQPFFLPALEAKRSRLTELVEGAARAGLAAP